ncbi:MAG: helix-turn-helix domain-containing protein [Acetobacteraceae bacterium]|nr:helix-turn-helix domain-containing protein [Acetobacteraceae bacterium]
MNSELRERLGRLERIPGEGPVSSGSPVILRIEFFTHDKRSYPRTIDAIRSLKRRGVSLLHAKRTVEEVMATGGAAVIALPIVEDLETLTQELAAAGVRATAITAEPVEVRSLREGLGQTREEFALRYGLEVETLRNWETGKRNPDATARAYLRAIANAPEEVSAAYAGTLRRRRDAINEGPSGSDV